MSRDAILDQALGLSPEDRRVLLAELEYSLAEELDVEARDAWRRA